MIMPSWNLIVDWQTIFHYSFMRTAFLAGTAMAIMAGVISYFVVLRGMAFASHTLANIGFAGAAGAALIGMNLSIGLLAFTVAGALGMGALGRRLYGNDLVVGLVLAISLGAGYLFISLYHGYATNLYAILFGQIVGITWSQVFITFATGIVSLLAMGLLYRRLLFASLDAESAEAKGLRVQWLSLAFLVVLGLVIAVALQIVGVLLIFALLVAPAAVAERLTSRPPLAIGLSVLLALFFTWGGLALSFYLPYPPGSFITTLAFAAYVVVRFGDGLRSLVRHRRKLSAIEQPEGWAA